MLFLSNRILHYLTNPQQMAADSNAIFKCTLTRWMWSVIHNSIQLSLLCVSPYRPKLASLDLSWCGFQGQQALVNALTTLPCLRSLVLEGNPLTLTPSYPGFTLDSLPRLFYLDASRVTPEDRHNFRGLAKMSGETVKHWSLLCCLWSYSKQEYIEYKTNTIHNTHTGVFRHCLCS